MAKKGKTYKTVEDLLQGDTPYHYGRSLYKYTDCGPWIAYVLEDGSTLYYEDAGNSFNGKKVIGVDIGSIVEGSDVEIGPHRLTFPFSEKDFDDTVKAIDDEASFYWERDNSHWYIVHGDPEKDGGENYYLHETWGDVKWEDGEPPEEVKAAVEALVKDPPDDLGTGHPFPLQGLAGWDIQEYESDATYW